MFWSNNVHEGALIGTVFSVMLYQECIKSIGFDGCAYMFHPHC